MDKYQGQGGEFEVDKATGERKRKGEAPKGEPAGGGARDRDGKPVKDNVDKCQPALPAAPARAPWDTESAEQQTKTKKGA
jgi:hypothetical protein